VSRPSETGGRLAAIVLFALLAPVVAIGGVTLQAPDTPPQPVPPAAGVIAGAAASAPVVTPVRPSTVQVRPPAPGLYQIRCWQHGRLLFEDRISLPADAAAYGIRVSGTDRDGRPMYVAETNNATCLVRIANDERSWPR